MQQSLQFHLQKPKFLTNEWIKKLENYLAMTKDEVRLFTITQRELEDTILRKLRQEKEQNWVILLRYNIQRNKARKQTFRP